MKYFLNEVQRTAYSGLFSSMSSLYIAICVFYDWNSKQGDQALYVDPQHLYLKRHLQLQYLHQPTPLHWCHYTYFFSIIIRRLDVNLKISHEEKFIRIPSIEAGPKETGKKSRNYGIIKLLAAVAEDTFRPFGLMILVILADSSGWNELYGSIWLWKLQP